MAYSTQWKVVFQNLDTGQYFTSYQDQVRVKINFNGSLTELFINNVEILSGIPYTSGNIEKIRITTGPLGTSSSDSIGHYNDMIIINGILETSLISGYIMPILASFIITGLSVLLIKQGRKKVKDIEIKKI